MKAIAIQPGTTNLQIVDRPEPAIQAPDEIKVRVLRVGICGTDREETSGGRSKAEPGKNDLVIGHEMLGQVVEAGSEALKSTHPGDYVVFTVRRGCGKCLPCLMNRPDMCQTGDYRERGIWGMDGYQAEMVVDRLAYRVQVPPELKAVGVLCEPTSVAEKAIDKSVRIQFARLPEAAATPDWLHGKRCLVAGLGPIGLLAAMILRLRGAQVYGMDIVEPDSSRPRWLAGIGGTYIDGRQVHADQVDDRIGAMDLILEATGVPSLAFNLLDALATNGIYVLTGIPGGDRPLQIPGADLIRQLVLDNQLMFGSVNAARDHYQMAVADLLAAHQRWGDHLNRLITQKVPYQNFQTAFQGHPADEIKTVIEWDQGGSSA